MQEYIVGISKRGLTKEHLAWTRTFRWYVRFQRFCLCCCFIQANNFWLKQHDNIFTHFTTWPIHMFVYLPVLLFQWWYSTILIRMSQAEYLYICIFVYAKTHTKFRFVWWEQFWYLYVWYIAYVFVSPFRRAPYCE